MNTLSHSSATVLFHRLGPYHHARLAVARRVLDISAIQGCRQDLTYDWAEVPHDGHFPLVTLFENGDSSNQPPSLVRAKMIEALDRLDPRAVAIPGWSGGLAFSALEWCVSRRRPAILMSESTVWDERRHSSKEWVKRRIVGLCSSALVGGRPHAEYGTQLGVPQDRVLLGYDAIDNDYFVANAKQVRSQSPGVRSRFGLHEQYFLASARFIEKKNLPRLIEAYALYRRKAAALRPPSRDASPSSVLCPPSSAPWDLVLLGDGPLRPTLNSQLSTLNLHACVHLPGFKQYPDLPAYYALAGAFVHASTTEQWGLVVNEAMASGLPVLVSNRCGCAPDLVHEGVNGFTFDPYNVDELAQLMLKLSTLNRPSAIASASADQLSTMGQASQRIIADWGPERFASGLKAAVDKALEVGPKKASWLDRLMLRLLMCRKA